MAKKTNKSAKSPAAKKGGKPAKKSPARSTAEHDGCAEIRLDDTESRAIDMVVDSKKLQHALEVEVNDAVTQAVRKICKRHGVSLTLAQAQNVAMVLFGD